MAITEQQKTSLLGVTSFMFNFAPDQASFERFETIIANNPSFYALGTDLARTEAYTSQFEEGATLAEKIDVILTRLGLEEGELGYTRGVDFITQRLEDGAPEGQVLMEIGEKLLQETPPEGLEGAAAVLKNKIAVSDAYLESGISGYSLDTMPNLMDSITAEDESVEAALAAIEERAEQEPEEPEEPTVPGETYSLTADADNLTGTENNDTFNAFIFDNQNTLQNGDVIDGGAGVDTLYAEIGNSQNFAISPRLTSVENVVISTRATSNGHDSADNNLDNGRSVQIDAGLSRGVTNWESNDSRADLIIEDVRINPTQVTKDVTITFRDSDPGNVDYAVYFDQQSLISEAPQTDNRLVLTMSNQLDVSDGFNPEQPLENIPYTHFSFELNGEVQVVELDLEDALTYDDLEAALEEALAAYPEITVTRSEDAQSFFSYNGTPRTADLFTLTVADGTIMPAQPGWNAEGGLPSDNSFSARVFEGQADTTDPLVTSTIVLDNVGRGSTGGDLVIGGLSAGSTSTSKGVQQFDITVEQSSNLQFLGSTADSLEVVNLVNDGNEHPDVIDGKVVNQAGNLGLQGAVDVAGFGFGTAVGKEELASDLRDQDLVGAIGQNSGYGLVNVREVNAENFVGDISLTAVLTGDVVEKYMDLNDQAPDAAADDNVMFQYNLGGGNDSLALAISSANLAEAGTTTREDFELIIDAGAGDDVIEVAIFDETGTAANGAVGNLANSATGNWYANSQENANLAIDAGAGDDTVITYGSGDWNINLGTGDDVVYAAVDSTTVNALWVFNATGPIGDLASGPNTDFGSLFKSRLTVDFLGFEATVELGLNTNTALEVNQAIKQAIQNDGVLSNLLEVRDGPGNTLIVESLVDGDMTGVDINVNIANPTANSFTAADVSAYNAAYNANVADVATLETLIQVNVTGFNGASYDSTIVENGADSTHTAENTINAGTGDDVIVLGTGSGYDTIVLEGVFGTNSIVHFDSVSTTDADVLDFTSYGVGVDAVTTTAAVNSLTVTDNEVNVVDFSAVSFASGVNFGNLNAEHVKAVIGTVAIEADSIILVHNGANDGEYKAFDVNSTNTTGADFTVDLIGVLDFGEAQTFTADNFA